MNDLIQKINVGDLIAGRFEVKAIMNESELGLTCLMQSPRTHENFLVKQLSFPCDDTRTLEIQRLVQPLQVIDHRSIASFKEFFVENQTGYIVMEYIDGESLESHLEDRRERGQILGLKAAYSFLANLCIGLERVHQTGYAYGCINPHTIFVTKQGRIRIANYACAALAENYLSDEQRNSYFGSPFSAPEVKAARFQAKPASDVYSLALLFAELLSSVSLRDYNDSKENFISSIPGITNNIKDSLFQAIQDDASRRFPTAQAFKDSLKRAVDAPGDSDLSSIVLGVNDLRALSSMSVDMAVLDPNTARKPDLFDDDSDKTPSRPIKPEVWIFQKDGMDYGPFDHDTLIQKFYDEVITESTSIFNTSTKKRQNLGTIPEFEKEVIEYLPLREKNRAQRLAEQKRKEKRIKAGGSAAALIIVGAIAAILLIPVIILALKPSPQPLDFASAFKPFEKRFEVPKVEELSLNVDDAQAKALFDPKATEAEREAAFAKWRAEHQRPSSGSRKGKAKSAGGGMLGEEIDTIVFTGEDGEELEPLEDWEIQEQCMNPRIYRKYNDCFNKYAGGRRMNVTVKFTIQQSGVVRNFSTSASGELNECLISALSSIKFRQFGGMTKKVSLPLSF